MATPATRDIEIEILAGLQELLAQQAVALKMMGRLHKSVDTWVQRRMQETMAEETEIERGRSRSRSPPRASAASDRETSTLPAKGTAPDVSYTCHGWNASCRSSNNSWHHYGC